MSQPLKVCSRCGAAIEDRPDWVASVCPACAEAADSAMPRPKRRSLWWLLVFLVGPGLINLALAGSHSQKIAGAAVTVAFAGAALAGIVSLVILAPRIPGPILVRLLLALIVFAGFTVASFMLGCWGCMIAANGIR